MTKKKKSGKKPLLDAAARRNARNAELLASDAFAGLRNIPLTGNTQAMGQLAPGDRRKATRREPTNILQTAEKLIYGDRNKTYSHPTENFTNIANFWNAYLEAISRRPGVLQQVHCSQENLRAGRLTTTTLQINELDVANLNILQKVARCATSQDHMDTITDIAGYAGCQERILKNK